MRRQTFPAARAEGAPAREVDSRRPSTHDQRSHSLLWWNRRTADRRDTLTSILSLAGRGGREAPGEGRPLYSDFRRAQSTRRSRAWLFAAGSAVEHLVRRRIAAAKASRTFVGRFRHSQFVHLRRANHGTAFRRCSDAAAIISAPCGSRAFTFGDRAQSGGD